MFRYVARILTVLLLVLTGTQSTALFTSPDWFDPTQPGVGTNRYSYSGNDPINRSDPSGNAYAQGAGGGTIGQGFDYLGDGRGLYRSWKDPAHQDSSQFSGTSTISVIDPSMPRQRDGSRSATVTFPSSNPHEAGISAEEAFDLGIEQSGNGSKGASVGSILASKVPDLMIGAFEGAGTGRSIGSPSPRQTRYADGSFSVSDWSGYPSGVPRPPSGATFRILTGSEYAAARALANSTNQRIRRQTNIPPGHEIHEIIPVKFGGSPTDMANKVLLPRGVHRSQVTPWWNRLRRDLGN